MDRCGRHCRAPCQIQTESHPKTASSPNHGGRSGEYATKPIVAPGHFLAGLYHRRARGEATAFAGSRGEVHHLLAEWRRGGKEALSSAASERKRTGGVYLGMCFFEGTLRSLIQKESKKKTSFWGSRCFDTGPGRIAHGRNQTIKLAVMGGRMDCAPSFSKL